MCQSLSTAPLTHFPLIHPWQPHLSGGHPAMVQPMSRTVQLHRSALMKKNYSAFMCRLPDKTLFFCIIIIFLLVSFSTCVIEPPGLEEEMSGGGSGMVRGLTAASLPLSCGRAGSEGWPLCWNAADDRPGDQGTFLVAQLWVGELVKHCWLCATCWP